MIFRLLAVLVVLAYATAVVLGVVAAATSSGGDPSTHLGQVAGVLVGAIFVGIPVTFLVGATWAEGDRR